MNRSIALQAALVATTVLCGGCQSVPARVAGHGEPSPSGHVTRVVALWSDATLQQTQVAVTQGFAAKLYFLDPSGRPTTSCGKVTIYAYDDTDRAHRTPNGDSVKPVRVWEVSATELQSRCKKDAIGWSYSIWLPFGSPAAAERRFSLMLSYAPNAGPALVTEASLVTLRGLNSPARATFSSRISTGPHTPAVLGTELLAATP